MNKLIIFTLILVLIFSCSSKFLITKNNKYEITSPKVNWTISFPSENLDMDLERITGEGRVIYYLFKNEDTGLIASFFIEPAIKHDNTKDYRDYYWEKQKTMYPNAENVIKTNYPEYALLEYFVPEYYEVPLKQQHMNAMYVEDGYWIDVHLSKTPFTDNNKDLFYDFIKSISFVKKTNFKKYASKQDSIKQTTFMNFGKGSVSYLKADYPNAIKWFQKALDAEKLTPTLEKDYWRVLVDNLGMAYGISGILDKAKETFEYGLSREPDYPMFYYNLACTYAEMNNLDKCLENLITAYAHKNNMIEGEHMPDPKKDSSFQRFLNEKKFQHVLSKLGLN